MGPNQDHVVEPTSSAPSKTTSLLALDSSAGEQLVASSSKVIYVRIPVSELEPLDSDIPTDEKQDGQEEREERQEKQSYSTAHLAPPAASTTTDGNGNGNGKPKKASRLHRLSDSLTGKKHSEHHKEPEHVEETVRLVKMTMEEYQMYFARDKDGRYTGTMPEESGREWWARRLEAGKRNNKIFHKDRALMDGMLALTGGTYA